MTAGGDRAHLAGHLLPERRYVARSEAEGQRHAARISGALNLFALVLLVAGLVLIGRGEPGWLWCFLLAGVPKAAVNAARRCRERRLAARYDALVAQSYSVDPGELERFLEDARWHPTYHAFALHFAGSLAMHRRDYARARSVCAGLLLAGWDRAASMGDTAPQLVYSMAMSELALGDLEGAARSVDECERQLGEASALVVRVLLLLRQGRSEDAVATVTAKLAEAERVQTALFTKSIRVLWAFAISRGRGDGYRTEARSSEIDGILAGVRPVAPDQLEWLGHGYPELAAFLTDHGLAKVDETDPAGAALAPTEVAAALSRALATLTGS